MNPNSSAQQQLELEIRGLTPEEQLKRLQKAAIDQGVSISDVNQFILREWGGFISEELKSLMLHQENRRGPVPNASLEGRPDVAPSFTEAQKPSVEKPIEQKPAIQGQVEILDVKERMKKIQSEIGSISKEDASKAEIIKQTAEKKEQTTTQGTQSTDAGATSRIALDNQHMYGYEPSQEIASQMEEIAEHGEVSDSKTWQAMLMQRLSQMWGGIQKLFSQAK